MFRRGALVLVPARPLMRPHSAQFLTAATTVAHRHQSSRDDHGNSQRSSSSSSSSSSSKQFRLATIAAVSLFGVVKCAPVSDESEFVEPSSGFSFPRRLDDGKQLVSASLRTLSYVFHTYVVAFYVDSLPRVNNGVSLDKFETFERESAPRVIADLLDNATSNLKLELRPSRDTIGNHLVSAWRPKLQLRLSGGDSTPLSPADAALLDTLGEILNKRRFLYRSSLMLDWDKRKHALKISHDGVPVATIENADRVARALFAMYVDEKSTVSNIKRDFTQGLFDALKKQ